MAVFEKFSNQQFPETGTSGDLAHSETMNKKI